MKTKNLCILICLNILGIMLISGCVQEKTDFETNLNEGLTCYKPYIKVMGGCCLDKNENYICDKNETYVETEQKVNKKTAYGRLGVDAICLFYTLGGRDYNECYKEFSTIYEGIKKEGIQYCDYNPSIEGFCRGFLALDKNNVQICQGAINANNKWACMGLFAAAKQDASICEKISESEGKDGCNFCVAAAKQDASICEKISESTIKNECIKGAVRAKEILVALGKQEVITDKPYMDMTFVSVCSPSDIDMAHFITSGDEKYIKDFGGGFEAYGEEVKVGGVKFQRTRIGEGITNTMPLFLTSIALKNDNFIIASGDEIYITENLARTELGYVLLDSGLQLKEKLSEQVLYNGDKNESEYLNKINEKWISELKNTNENPDSYCYSQLNFADKKDVNIAELKFIINVSITPGKIIAQGFEYNCSTFIVNADINADIKIEKLYVKVSGVNLTLECKNELQSTASRMLPFIENLTYEMILPVINESINKGYEFSKLKSAYTSIAQAQYYKTHVQGMFYDLIDTNNITKLNTNPVDKTKYLMKFESLNTYYPLIVSIDFRNITMEVLPEMDYERNALISEALSGPISKNGTYYIGTGFYTPRIDLVVISVNETENNIVATIENKGIWRAYDAVISFYYDSVNDSHLIYTEEIDIDPADSKNVYLMWENQNLTGNHTIYAAADPKEYIIEINEKNNQGNISLSFPRAYSN